MIFIPGFVIAAITFPGVIVHELAHQVFCFLRRVPVYEVVYFQAKSPVGYVAHEPCDNPFTNFIVSVGPFIVNTVIGALILLPASVEMTEFGMLNSMRAGNVDAASMLRALPMLIAYWLGVSVLMHAFPSTGDANALVSSVLKNRDVSLPIRALVAPVVGLIYIGAVGSVVLLDLGYAILVSTLLPKAIGLLL